MANSRYCYVNIYRWNENRQTSSILSTIQTVNDDCSAFIFRMTGSSKEQWQLPIREDFLFSRTKSCIRSDSSCITPEMLSFRIIHLQER